jgi:hypothetical protein
MSVQKPAAAGGGEGVHLLQWLSETALSEETIRQSFQVDKESILNFFHLSDWPIMPKSKKEMFQTLKCKVLLNNYYNNMAPNKEKTGYAQRPF